MVKLMTSNNLVFYLATQLCTLSFSVVMSISFTHLMGITIYGHYMVAITSYNFMLTFGANWVNSIILRFYSSKGSSYVQIISNTFWIQLIVIFLTLFVFFIHGPPPTSHCVARCYRHLSPSPSDHLPQLPVVFPDPRSRGPPQQGSHLFMRRIRLDAVPREAFPIAEAPLAQPRVLQEGRRRVQFCQHQLRRAACSRQG